jgi:hypothetical protein
MSSDDPLVDPGSEESGDRPIRERKIAAPLWKIVDQIEQANSNNSKKEKEEKDHKKHSLAWNKGDVIFSIIFSTLSVGIAFLTYTILTKQTTILENQLRAMRVDQRAWINVQIKITKLEEGQPLQGMVTFSNTGKTPAKKVGGTGSIQKVAANKSPKVQGFHDTVISGLILPGGELPLPVTSRDDKSAINLTKTDIEELRSGKAYIAILGKFGYDDIYDTTHWIKYCLWKDFSAGTYSAAECVNHNEIDKD